MTDRTLWCRIYIATVAAYFNTGYHDTRMVIAAAQKCADAAVAGAPKAVEAAPKAVASTEVKAGGKP
jgi:hypothetical protein